MSASFTPIKMELLLDITKDILNKMINSVSCVFFDITNKPPGTIEWE